MAITEYVIIGLLCLNLLVTLISEKKRRDLTRKVQKEGTESINSFLKIFGSLDKKLGDALAIITVSPVQEMQSPILHMHPMHPLESIKSEIEEGAEQAKKVEKNIETYISNLQYASDKFAETPEERKIIYSLIRNIEKQYGKSTRSKY